MRHESVFRSERERETETSKWDPSPGQNGTTEKSRKRTENRSEKYNIFIKCHESRFTLIIFTTIFFLRFVNACYEFILMLCQRLDEEILRDEFVSIFFHYSSSFWCLCVNLLFAFNGIDSIYLFTILMCAETLLTAHCSFTHWKEWLSFHFHLQMAFLFSYFQIMITISRRKTNKNIECRRRQNTIQITEG